MVRPINGEAVSKYVSQACGESFKDCLEAMCKAKHFSPMGEPIGRLRDIPQSNPNFIEHARGAAAQYSLSKNVLPRIENPRLVANKTWARRFLDNNPDICPPPSAFSKVRQPLAEKMPVKNPKPAQFVSLPGVHDVASSGVNWTEGLKSLGWGVATVGTAVLTVAAGSATVVAAGCPFDGVAGEIVLGAGTAKSAALTGLSAGAFWVSSRNFIASLF